MRRNKFKSLRKFEVLEDRRMMAGDISYNSSSRVLTIDGAGLDDVAVVRFEGNKVYADLTAGEIDDDGDLGTDHSDLDKKISDVSRIVFNGFAGNDDLTVLVNKLNSGVTLNNIVLEFHGGENDDSLFNQLQGGVKTVAFGDAGRDILQGSKFDDTLEGGTGDDDLSGSAGNDTYVFSGSTTLGTDSILNESANVGTDTLDFANFVPQNPLFIVNLANVYDPSAANPLYATPWDSSVKLKLFNNTAIENVIGTAINDEIIGNSRPNNLSGRGGNDYITGAGGNDTLEGGKGNDAYYFSGANLGTDTIKEAANADKDYLGFAGMLSGLTVDLTKFGSNYAVNSTDLKLILASATAIEDVGGTDFKDTIIGNSRDNTIFGRDGNDVITGGGGADSLFGGSGDDQLWTDALDEAYGSLGKDRFDEYSEGTPNLANPRPTRYKDWKFFDPISP